MYEIFGYLTIANPNLKNFYPESPPYFPPFLPRYCPAFTPILLYAIGELFSPVMRLFPDSAPIVFPDLFTPSLPIK